ncbi:hypothetical protein [uncultured Tolumonas sp.]|uniref:hypothetical protein n=1 Tax=uncultured Tolumonas sp. TaxID=263765 RepID=UPI00292E7B80|nr:hypothetical protein [uncultured Tolumonas sp.]
MIYLDTQITDEFLERYLTFCLAYMRPKLNAAFDGLTGELRDKLNLYFDDTGLRLLLSSNASVLKVAFEEIFEGIPILAERFNPKHFFNSLKVDTECKHLNLRTTEGKQAIANIKINVLTKVNDFITNKPSILLAEFIEEMNQANKASEIKAQLVKLTSIVNGTIQANVHFKEKFPNWLEYLSRSFNYDHVIANFGVEIVSLIDLHYCPYCADEVIEPFERYRPAIDHYYPKSKFPFLALSLHNFVPAGDRCNSRFKKNNDMIGYFNPAHDELPNKILFDFEYPLGRDFLEEEIKVIVKNISDNLHANSILFALEDVYNKIGIKKEFKLLYERVNYQKSLGSLFLDDPQQIRLHLDVDLTLSQKKVRYQKFLVDSLNFLANCNLVIKR